MPYTNSWNIFCPCCGTKIFLSNEEGKLVGTVRQDINTYYYITKEESLEGPGNLRPGELSESVHEGLHGEAKSPGAPKAKFDRNKYQRELMRKRRKTP